ncbi:MAG: hypothetical protein K0R10_1387 [Alphaproteobacteria bacterium]|jgi:hypothetical protein|nr:hypothetical protein [Alphaproteobacteria bacterium]
MIESSTYTSGFRGEDRTAGMTSARALTASPSKAMMSDATKFSGMVDEASNAGETEKVAGTKHKSGFGGFLSFLGAILDIINPLQHIPVISTIYRNITGDEISPMARVAGDALYGGPIGAAVGLANVAVEHKTGKDIGENVMAMFNKKSGKNAPDEIQVAENKNGQRLQDIAWNDAAPQDKAQGVLYARNAADADKARATLSPAAPAAPATQQPVNDDGARNALMAFARDMRSGATASQEIDVTAMVKNDKPQGVLYARDDASANATKQDFPSSPGPAPTKLSYRTGATGNGPAAYSYKDGTMVPTPKSGPAGSNGIMPAQGQVNVKTALLSQEVPAASGENRAVPSELIAKQMMVGLDKYAAMSRL